MLPSWIRSRKERPRLVYFLAMEMTRRRLASTISVLAWMALRGEVLQLRVGLEIIRAGHADEFLQRLDLVLLGFDDVLLLGGLARAAPVPSMVRRLDWILSWMLSATSVISSMTFCL